jgi:hypothetical protein
MYDTPGIYKDNPKYIQEFAQRRFCIQCKTRITRHHTELCAGCRKYNKVVATTQCIGCAVEIPAKNKYCLDCRVESMARHSRNWMNERNNRRKNGPRTADTNQE